MKKKLNIYNAKTGNKLTPFIGTDGYYQVARRINSKKSFHIRVHVLYANLFIENPNNYKYINHIDSNKLNNSLQNLEWCSNSYNVKHGWESGNRTHKNNTKVRVTMNGNLIGEYKSIRELSRELKLNRHKVARILKGELSKDYLKYSFDYI